MRGWNSGVEEASDSDTSNRVRGFEKEKDGCRGNDEQRGGGR